MLAVAAIYPVEVVCGPRPKWASEKFDLRVFAPKILKFKEEKHGRTL